MRLTDYAGVKTAPGGQDISSTYDSHLEFIAASLADVPGGLDVLYEIARHRYPDEILPYKQFFLKADPNRFGPKLKKAIRPIITEELIPEFVGRNRASLRKLAAAVVSLTLLTAAISAGAEPPPDEPIELPTAVNSLLAGLNGLLTGSSSMPRASKLSMKS